MCLIVKKHLVAALYVIRIKYNDPTIGICGMHLYWISYYLKYELFVRN